MERTLNGAIVLASSDEAFLAAIHRLERNSGSYPIVKPSVKATDQVNWYCVTIAIDQFTYWSTLYATSEEDTDRLIKTCIARHIAGGDDFTSAVVTIVSSSRKVYFLNVRLGQANLDGARPFIATTIGEVEGNSDNNAYFDVFGDAYNSRNLAVIGDKFVVKTAF